MLAQNQIPNKQPGKSTTSMSTEVLAEATACYRGIGGWVQKKGDIALVNNIVPNFFLKRLNANLSLQDQRELIDLKENFKSVFERATSKGCQVSEIDPTRTASLILLAKKWIDLRVKHFHKLSNRIPEGFLKRITEKSAAQQEGVANKIHPKLDKILNALTAS